MTAPAAAADGFTLEDLEAMPDDGRRYELLDGQIVVSPAPDDWHQGVVTMLLPLLRAHCPSDLRVRTAPYDADLSRRSRAQPDLLVVRRSDVVDGRLRGAPLLAVEILSPSTRRNDLGTKFQLYAEAGWPSYWVIDPGRRTAPASLTAWELVDGAYVEVAHVTGTESWTTTRPFSVTLVPDELLDD